MELKGSDEFNDYVVVTDSNAIEYECNISRKRSNVTDETVLLSVRHKEYPGMPKMTAIEEVDQWVADGHGGIDKVPWTSTHPDIFPATGEEKSNLLVAAQDLVGSLTCSDIDDHIDNTFGVLSTPQKNSLKKLYKVVLYLAKRSGK